ncbi:MAG: hypothetical protein RL086_731 [Bacteroidota bacterium]|jgi:hypothetical protein
MKPIERFRQKWASNDYLKLHYEIQENYTLKNGEVVDIGIIFKGKCIAFGKYFSKLNAFDNPDSNVYFMQYGKEHHQDEIEFAFYFDNNSLIINDLRINYPLDESSNDYNLLFDRIKKRTEN